MNRSTFHSWPAVWLLLMTGAVDAGTRNLAFDERVEAQRTIEQIYYSYQIGADLPFDEAVPREILERKVHLYLRQSVALSRFWNTTVTDDSLRQELRRIEQATRFPDRLQQVYKALDDDPMLLQECLARPTLVDRLAHSFFASDERIHAAGRQQ